MYTSPKYWTLSAFCSETESRCCLPPTATLPPSPRTLSSSSCLPTPPRIATFDGSVAADVTVNPAVVVVTVFAILRVCSWEPLSVADDGAGFGPDAGMVIGGVGGTLLYSPSIGCVRMEPAISSLDGVLFITPVCTVEVENYRRSLRVARLLLLLPSPVLPKELWCHVMPS